MLIADAEAILRLLQLRSYLYLACIDNWRSGGSGGIFWRRATVFIRSVCTSTSVASWLTAERTGVARRMRTTDDIPWRPPNIGPESNEKVVLKAK